MSMTNAHRRMNMDSLDYDEREIWVRWCGLFERGCGFVQIVEDLVGGWRFVRVFLDFESDAVTRRQESKRFEDGR